MNERPSGGRSFACACRAVDRPFAPAPAPHMQPLFAVDAEQAFMVHHIALAPQEHMQPPPYGQWIAEPAAHLGEFLQPLPQRGIILSDRLLAHGHSAKPLTWRARRLLIP